MAMFDATDKDTIAAIATAPGKGGIGIIRLSGASLEGFFQGILGVDPEPRQAWYGNFCNDRGDPIDQGIALYFPAPHSFTGEHVLELQAHGGPVVLDMLLERCLQLGARLARPGEFTERAFINDKVDLAQAEAIADLIDASSREAALGAVKSLQGDFSNRIHELVSQLIHLRMYVESAIDFPEEEVDFLSDGKIADDLDAIISQLTVILEQSRQGALIQEGMMVVLAGRPNAGKSSLLNALSGRESAIVTHMPGTTRDVLRESIHLDGMPLHIVDTAGLRQSDDAIEQEGIRRAWLEIEKADRVLYLIDSTEPADLDQAVVWPDWLDEQQRQQVVGKEVTLVLNKVDLSRWNGDGLVHDRPIVALSAKTGEGVEQLVKHLQDCMGYRGAGEGVYTARRRHLDALVKSLDYLEQGKSQLVCQVSGELLAEDLRMAQNQLSAITGRFTSDDLLGEIFSSFCIGK